MKKSIRILSILMAFVMLIGSFSVVGSAYQEYKGSAIAGQYNDVDAPEFTLEQYASMALDELDRMLAKEQIKLDLLGMLKLDLTSVDATIGSVLSFLETGKALIGMLGDASTLETICTPLKAPTAKRSGGSDLQVIYALLDFVSNLKGIAHNYVEGSINAGILDGFIVDFKFNVRELAIGILYGLTPAGSEADYDYFDDEDKNGDGKKDGLPVKYQDPNNGAITLAQDLLNGLVLGTWTKLNDYFNDKYSVVMPESYAFVAGTWEGDKLVLGEDVSDEPIDTSKYDYYGYVHQNDWVTVGLGDAIRVAKDAKDPAESYKIVDITTDTSGYDFIEALMRRAYNYILIPVLNRDTRGAVLKLCGYTVDETKSKKKIWGPTGEFDENGEEIWDMVNNTEGYVEGYIADPPKDSEGYTEYAKLFNHEALANGLMAEKATITAGHTFVEDFNTTLGKFIERFGSNNYKVVGEDKNEVTYSWTWDYSRGNAALFDNIVEVGKYILIVTGGLFFEEGFDPPSPAEIQRMDGQAIVSLIMREILNNSVDYIYVDSSVNTIVDVGYAAVEQLAWQDIPQMTYTKPKLEDCKAEGDKTQTEVYYEKVVEKMLDILLDIAVYNINKSIDAVIANGTDPDDPENNGLLQYQGNKEGGYKTTMVHIATWAVRNYGAILALPFRCNADTEAEVAALTADDVWADIDTIIDQIIPIKQSSGSWISKDIATQPLVSKAFIFDYLLKPIYTLNATNLVKIFDKNTEGTFAKMNGVEIIIDILDNVFGLLFPGVFKSQDSLDAVLQNGLLADMVHDLIGSLCSGSFTNAAGNTMDGRGDSIAQVALPVVCMILGLSADQEFEQMEIYMPGLISTTGNLPSIEVYNGSSGINTAYTSASGKTTQDQLYTYQIVSADIKTYNDAGVNISTLNIDRTNFKTGTTIAGGNSVSVPLTGSLTDANIGNLVEFTVNYVVLGEDGKAMTAEAEGTTVEAEKIVLSKTIYAYIGDTDKDDDAIEQSQDNGDRKVKYENSIYIDGGDDLDDFEGNIIRIEDNKGGAEATAKIESVTMLNNPSHKFVTKESTELEEVEAKLTGAGNIYFLYPFALAKKNDTDYFERLDYIYEEDEDGNTRYDENGDPIIATENGQKLDNGGVPNGKYQVRTVVDINGSDTTIDTTINLYNDYGLESEFDRAVLANRQLSDYDTEADMGAAGTLYTNYVKTLKDVAKFVLKPKTADSFQTDIATTSSEYENKYEELAVALEDAIAKLEKYAKNAGTKALKEDLAKYTPINYVIVDGDYEGDLPLNPDGPYKADLEYYEEGYAFYGMHDFVPHTYRKYRTARERVTDLVDSQEIFVPAPLKADATDDEKAEYAAKLAEYEVALENKGVINSIEALYARHMLNLTGERLIRVSANTSKLAIVNERFSGKVPAGTDGQYTVSSIQRYRRAEAFTAGLLAADIDNITPSQVNFATTELVKAWKNLEFGIDYTQLDSAIAAAEEKLNDGIEYSEETRAALETAYDNAVNVDRDLADTTSNNELLSKLSQAIYDAIDKLEEAKAAEAVYELITDEIFMDPTMNNFTAPVVNRDKIEEFGYYHTTVDGDEITAYIYGLGVYALFDEDEVINLFATLENCSVEVIPNPGVDEDNVGGYGNGAAVKIVADDGTVKDVYCLLVMGDITGDGVVDTTDGSYIYQYEATQFEWEYFPEQVQYWFASDVNNDATVDSNDAAQIALAEAGTEAYDMITGEIYEL